jgi:hypothetical protein
VANEFYFTKSAVKVSHATSIDMTLERQEHQSEDGLKTLERLGREADVDGPRRRVEKVQSTLVHRLEF